MRKMILLGFLCYLMICLTGCSNEIKNNPYFYDDDELKVKWLDTDQKLMENGEVVCQFEEMSEENEDSIKSISLLTDNKVRYTRYNKKANGETGFYEWFTWEQDKGLVEYGSGFGAGGEILYLTQIKELIDV